MVKGVLPEDNPVLILQTAESVAELLIQRPHGGLLLKVNLKVVGDGEERLLQIKVLAVKAREMTHRKNMR